MSATFADLLKKCPYPPTFLAPMESVTDAPFRQICKRMGADFLISEFVASDALIRNIAASVQKMSFSEAERPVGIQIFGNNERSLCQAAEVAANTKPDFIDINWGCPVKKIVNNGCGSAILKEIDKMVALTKAVVDHIAVPVTVKTRLGWDDHDKPIVCVAERLQDIGIQAITIHGRTRAQMYNGVADWSLIGAVKNNPRMTIPVIGNGDIVSAAQAIEFQQRYGVDGVMIGRAAIGNPWIFDEIRQLRRGATFVTPNFADRAATCLEHLRGSATIRPEKVALLEMRKHYAGYFKGFPNFKEKRMELMKAESINACEEILNSYQQWILQNFGQF